MRKLKRPVEEVRAELLADRATQSIAKRLGLPVEAYVEKVLDYALHPGKQPKLKLLPESVVKARGGNTIARVKKWFAAVRAGKVDLRDPREKDGFEGGQHTAPPPRPRRRRKAK
ncbi:MAG: hypothetical protein HY901_28005 [Deltaproteobacteria bacterium]|nr:hypothetical protein [Deltaproteobacteria bacterium]